MVNLASVDLALWLYVVFCIIHIINIEGLSKFWIMSRISVYSLGCWVAEQIPVQLNWICFPLTLMFVILSERVWLCICMDKLKCARKSVLSIRTFKFACKNVHSSEILAQS